jgi:poly-gamma-glutamate synthesis protein (capsule biosynthesis protein)
MKLTAASFMLLTALICLPVPLQAEEVIINAVGDVMLAGRWASSLQKSGYDYPFRAVAAELKKGDITLANLESPLARGGKEFTDKKFRFRADPEVAPALKESGINLVTLANNHIMDFGEQALLETLQHLDSAGIGRFGAGKNLAEARTAVHCTIKGKRFAFLGYSLTQPTGFFAGSSRAGTAPGYDTFFVTDITNARKQADHVIVSFHWGTEGLTDIQANQREVAHKAIDAGADVIIGHHPHVLRGIERYKRGIIFYSLGNFTFASKSRTADYSAIIRFRFDDGKQEAEILPLDILYRRVKFQPQLLSGEPAGEVIERLNRLSRPYRTKIESRDGHYMVSF